MSLKKELGFWDIFCISSGAMISSGLFILPAIAYAMCGKSVFVAYFLAGVLVLPALFSKAELSTAMPKSGGDYFHIDRSLGPIAGTLSGMAAWFSLSFKSAFALLGIGAFVRIFLPDFPMWQIKLVAVVFCIIFMILNIYGAKHAGRLQIVLVLFLLGILSYFVVAGLPSVDFSYFRADDNFWPSHRVLLGTVGMIFVSYGGLTKVVSVAEETKNVTLNLPFGMISAFVVVTIFYVLVVFITVGVLQGDIIKQGMPSLTPISDAATVFMGPAGGMILAVAALLAFISTGNAGIMAASRTPMAMAKDNLLPEKFGKLAGKGQTPVFAIVATSAFMIVVILFLDLQMLIKTASTLKILLFAASNLVLIVMRESKMSNYRPKFKSPFYPWVQIFGLIAYAFLIFEMGTVPLSISAGFIALSLLWYWCYGRQHSDRAYVLQNIVDRIIGKKLRSKNFSEELRNILLQREEIITDFFDETVLKASVLDIPASVTQKTALEMVSEKLAERLGADKSYYLEKLKEREEIGSTLISSFLAIPHIILEGENLFELVIVRCRQGIDFGDGQANVQAVFALAGSMDMRIYHLKALAALAQIVQNRSFEQRWMRATSESDLKDVLILASRRR